MALLFVEYQIRVDSKEGHDWRWSRRNGKTKRRQFPNACHFCPFRKWQGGIRDTSFILALPFRIHITLCRDMVPDCERRGLRFETGCVWCQVEWEETTLISVSCGLFIVSRGAKNYIQVLRNLCHLPHRIQIFILIKPQLLLIFTRLLQFTSRKLSEHRWTTKARYQSTSSLQLFNTFQLRHWVGK